MSWFSNICAKVIMQQEGGLRKRRRRNISKVGGLSLIPYTTEFDFDWISNGKFPVREHSVSSQASFQRAQKGGKVKICPTDTDTTEVDITELKSQERKTAVEKEPGQEGIGEKKDGKIFENFLLNDTVTLRLRQIIMIGVTSMVFPWSWDSKSRQVVKLGDKRVIRVWWVAWSLVAFQTGVLTMVQTYLIAVRVMEVDNSELRYRAIFANYLAIFWYMFTTSYTAMMYLHMDDIQLYINTLITMHRDLSDSYLIDAEEYPCKPFRCLDWAMVINVGQLVASVAIFLLTPYQRWYLYSYIPPHWELPWWTLLPGAVQQYLVVGNTLTNFLLILWLVTAHATVLSFWLEELHRGNDTGCTRIELRSPQNVVRIYRSFQVLNNLFNNAVGSVGIPVIKCTVFFGIIPCAFVLIRTPRETFIAEFPGILTYPIGVANCVLVGFAIMSYSAKMNDLAAGFVGSWCRTGHHDFRRVLRALRTIKVMVCGLYEIGVGTTIHFSKTTIDYVVNSVITFK